MPRRLLLLSYFEPDDAPKLIRAIRATRTPPDTPIYVGSYGVNGPVGRQVQELKRGRYAPMFPIKPGTFWTRRRVEGADEPRYEGPLPTLTAEVAAIQLTLRRSRVEMRCGLAARYLVGMTPLVTSPRGSAATSGGCERGRASDCARGSLPDRKCASMKGHPPPHAMSLSCGDSPGKASGLLWP